RKILTIIIAVVLVFSFIAFVSLVVQVAGGKKPSVFGYRLYYILTDSMTPELQVNDVILSETINSKQEAKNRIKEGDVVTYIAQFGIQKGLTITHKVVKGPHYDEEIGKEVITTMGTKSGATPDPPVPLENIQAVMIKKLPILGGFYRFIMSTAGLLTIIILPMAIMLAFLVYRLVAHIKKPIEKEQSISVEEYKKKEQEIARKAVEEYKQRNNITS
ncbi:MAG: hypothetical protein WBM21_03730, partial [Christensenellales bacterium]